VCTEDLAIPTELQRQRASPRARLIDFPSGHHPFLSQPEALVQRSPLKSTRSPNQTDRADEAAVTRPRSDTMCIGVAESYPEARAWPKTRHVAARRGLR
jgi:hypothetical protein